MLFRISVFLFGLLVLFSLVFSQPDSLNMKLVGMWEVPDTARVIRSFDVDSGELYVATEVNSSPWYRYTLYGVDVSIPSSPAELTEIEDTIGTFESKIYRNHLYASYGHDGGLVILDITQPSVLHIDYKGYIVRGIGYIYPYSDSMGDNYLAAACIVESEARIGIRILDVTVPSSPELLSWYYVPEPIHDGYHIIEHNLCGIDVKYPNLFSFETIERYDTTGPFGGVYESGWIEVKKFDLRDLSSPPVVWRTDEETISDVGIIFLGGIANESSIYVLALGYHFLAYNDTSITEICGSFSDDADYHFYPKFAVNDTYFVLTRSSKVMGIKLLDSCEIDTLGYYRIDELEHYGRIVVNNGYIYINDSYEFGERSHRIYILSWLPEQIDGQGYLQQKNDYRIYPSPVIYNTQLVLNRPTDKKFGIYDISGKLLKNIPKNRTRISTENFSPGLYFLISADKKVKIKFIVLE